MKNFNIEIKYFRTRQTVESMIEELSSNYDLFAFSVNVSNYHKCIQIAEWAKQMNPSSKIVFGGGYPTRYYKEVLKEVPCVDYLVLGDGEYPSEYLYDILAKQKASGNASILPNHESVATRSDFENKKDYFNTDITWEPAYDYYEKDNDFINSRKVHCIQIKNNICTGNCSFCTERHGKVVYKDIKQVVDQIEYVHNKYHVKKVYFTDDNILDPNTQAAKQHLKNLCLELKKRNLKLAYQCYIKAFSLTDTPADHDLLNLMREVGFVEIFIGIEAGNQEDLNLYNKFTTVQQNYDIIKILRQHDIFPIMGFIAFNPYSTKNRIIENFQYLCKTKCTYLHNYLYSFTVINKYTTLYNMIKKDKLLLSNESEYIDVSFEYQDPEVKQVLDYVRNEMLPHLRHLDYELDWVTYSAMEHEVVFKDIINYRPLLEEQKNKDAEWIKNHLKLLFEDFDVEAFKKVSDEFWAYFKAEENILAKIYDYYISLHYTKI